MPDYVEADHGKMTAKFARIPAVTDVPYPVADGTAPGRRILFALIASDSVEFERPPPGGLFLGLLSVFRKPASTASGSDSAPPAPCRAAAAPPSRTRSDCRAGAGAGVRAVRR